MAATTKTEVEEAAKRLDAGDMVLWAVFLALIAGAVFTLLTDMRQLTGLEVPGFEPRETRFTPPPGREDQVRRYQPETAPVRLPGQEPNLPGFEGDLDEALTRAMTFHIALDEAGNRVATAIGRIEIGSLEAFTAFLQQHPDLADLTLQSPGGSVQDALAMARALREAEINTAVAQYGYCASSCPLVFAGGVERTAPDPVWLGVHQVFTPPSIIGTLQEGMAGAQYVSSDAQQLLLDMGVDPAAWIHAMATPSDALYVFTREEIEVLRWVTDITE